jgi:general secretion pathway protein D
MFCCLALLASAAVAQQPATAPATAPAATRPAATLELNFPENMDLKVLVDYVGKRQGISFVYDDQIGNKKVTIKAQQKIPAESLMALLESVLAMKGLSLSNSEVPGMMRIDGGRSLTAIAAISTADTAEDDRTPLATTRIFEIKHANPQQVDGLLKPFLSAPNASITVLADFEMAIITDYTTNMKRLSDLIAIIDRPRRDVQVKFVAVRNLDSAALAQKVGQVLAGKAKARSPGTKDPAADVSIFPDERTNQVAVVGTAEPLADALELIAALDVPLGLETRSYALTTVSAERVDKLARELIGDSAARRLYRSAIDADANVLVASTTPEIHQQLQDVVRMVDKPADDGQSPIRFYKLENAKAADVVATLQSMDAEGGSGLVSIDGIRSEPRPRDPNAPVITGPTEAQVNAVPVPAVGGAGGETAKGRMSASPARGVRIMADPPSNTIIIVAKPSMQSVYERLIKRLDIRRPQVMVEATVMLLDTTDGFSLGVEISKNFDVSGGRALTFSAFGLSDVDRNTGALTLKPGVGFNGALLSSDIADIIIRAVASDSRAKVCSRPRVLINDNAVGTLVSENEEPFASVNASDSVATTSFAGYSSAGTRITVEPQISEGDHLKLRYEVSLSSFGDARTDSLPPARQRNTLNSEVTIPDGYTIVVGGLTRDNQSTTVDRVPGLGHIPILEYAFSKRVIANRKSTMFVFIRAVILRDDKFKDLKVLSRESTTAADLPGEFPRSEPREIR